MSMEMKLSFDQILALVRQLPKDDKIRLTDELEKEEIGMRLKRLLKAFKTDELTLDDITKETEAVRQKIYDRRKGN